MRDQTIQVVIVDDHDRYRVSLMNLLNAEQDLNVVGQGASAQEAIELASTLCPHLIVLDLEMPGNGLNAAEAISRIYPSIKIVMLSASNDEQHMQIAQQNGAHGYILKGTTARTIAHALRSIYDGMQIWPAMSVGSSSC